ncbi:MAG: efflux RND transporter periplasmic adaptor subunit [Ignavibacteriae bacterium]|nr:efflux RND transporter periplasmic adaptor subunit [Ignavibacteriota bacterium]
MKKIFVISSIIILGTLVLLVYSNYFSSEKKSDSETQSQEKEYYTCPMHPSVISDRPGACPVCGMALVKKSKMQDASEEEMKNLQHVSLSASQRVIANVSTTSVTRQDINKEISAVGVVDFAEPLQTTVTARFRGRIEKLYANFTGEKVKQGQPLFDLYSPDLVSAQREFIIALNSLGDSLFSGTNQSLMLNASRDRLRIHFGMTEQQIAAIEQTRQTQSTMTYFSPISGTVLSKEIQEGQYVDEGMSLYKLADLSNVWIYLDVYEKDIRFILINHPVQITTETYPNETFKGKVTFIDPVINNETRTVRVRTEFDNPNGKLKPQMYVKAQIHVPSSSALVVPATAVLYTGKRNVVWVEVQENFFEPREVELGISSGSYIEVLSGLKEEDIVVTSGGYLLESESQLQQPGGSSGGHQHDGTKKETEEEQQKSGDEHEGHQMQSDARIIVDGNYTPNIIHAKRGKKLTIAFERHDESKCTDEVVFEDFNIRKKLPSHQTTLIEITPQEAGEFRFTCGMDMVEGKLIVHQEN